VLPETPSAPPPPQNLPCPYLSVIFENYNKKPIKKKE